MLDPSGSIISAVMVHNLQLRPNSTDTSTVTAQSPDNNFSSALVYHTTKPLNTFLLEGLSKALNRAVAIDGSALLQRSTTGSTLDS
jgi:hypothetical protein